MNDDARTFVDTNVFIYANDATAGTKHERARELLKTIWLDGSGVVSVQVLQELYVNLTRKLRLPSADATAIVKELTQWSVYAPAPDDVLSAIRLHDRSKISFWDAMILRSASRMDCRTLWSEDLNEGQTYAGVTVRSPFTV